MGVEMPNPCNTNRKPTTPPPKRRPRLINLFKRLFSRRQNNVVMLTEGVRFHPLPPVKVKNLGDLFRFYKPEPRGIVEVRNQSLDRFLNKIVEASKWPNGRKPPPPPGGSMMSY